MGNNEDTTMQLKFQDSDNHSIFVTTSKVDGIGEYLSAANHGVFIQKFWVWNEQWQEFGGVIQLGQNRKPPKWLLNTGPGCFESNHASDLH